MKRGETHSVPHSRRAFLKSAFAGTLALCAAPALWQPSSAVAAESRGGNMLILYFSRSGNTRSLAKHIHRRVGGDIIELETVAPYPPDYDAVVEQARQEQRRNARPEIRTSIPCVTSSTRSRPSSYSLLINFINRCCTSPMVSPSG